MEFLRIAITLPGLHPDGIAGEASRITEMLRDGMFDMVHIRKPERDGWNPADTEELLRLIPEELHPRIRLHYQHELTSRFPLLAGVQLNRENPEPPTATRSWSAGCHNYDECLDMLVSGAAYVTLSPVFDSISKPGYQGRFATPLPPGLRGKPVIALGGVTFRDIPRLKEWGYAGGAMLGEAWKNVLI